MLQAHCNRLQAFDCAIFQHIFDQTISRQSQFLPASTMSFFTQITDALNLCSGEGDVVRKVRTTADPPMAPEDALELLKEGNSRFVAGRPLGSKTQNVQRHQLVDEGQAPHTAIIGCADSRAPLETIFDAMPGDIFVLRNAGNTCSLACS